MTSDRDPPPGTPPRADVPASASDEITIIEAAPDGVPEPVGGGDSSPVAARSGRVRSLTQGGVDRSRRMASALQGAISGGVSRLGGGIERVGEGVSRLGEATRKVPLVGAGVAKIGVGIASVGDVMQQLPRVAKTQRGRVLVRSMIVGFSLVFVWIAAIVGLQLWGGDTYDFRPDAERILVDLSKGGKAIDDIYEHASPRFQEMVRKERFVDDMTDMNSTVGKFKEITAINDTLETTGPAGQIGRVSLTVAYDKATCKDSVSFHFDKGEWKLLGIGVELPSELHITEAQRQGRVAGCKEDQPGHPCEVRRTAERILTQLREGKVDDVYRESSAVFQQVVKREVFEQLNSERISAVGRYKRIISVTDSKLSDAQHAALDVLVEYDRGIVAVTFKFYREDSSKDPWLLSGFKAVLPLPRSSSLEHAAAGAPIAVPGDGGVADAGATRDALNSK